MRDQECTIPKNQMCILYMSVRQCTHSVHSPTPLSAGGGGVEPPTKFSNEGGSLAGHQLLEGGGGEGGCNFLINNKI